MKIYIYTDIEQAPKVLARSHLVAAELGPGGEEYRVHHPEAGYSVWPSDQFEAVHRPLTRRESQLINMSTAELEVMAISDIAPDLVERVGELELVPDPAA